MSLFVDTSSKIDQLALREFAHKRMNQLLVQVRFLLTSSDNADFWNQLHILIVSKSESEKKQLLRVESQLLHLDSFIDEWIRMAVESDERFAFFVKTKAEEIDSGDEKKDYFWALQIRHDQLIAILRVLELLLIRVEEWVEMKPDEVVRDGVFLGLEDSSIEEQIYLEAEKVKIERDNLVG